MPGSLRVLSASFTPAYRGSADAGLLGLARVELVGGWVLDSVAVRRRRTGSAYIAFPARDGRRGRRSYPFRPTCERARREFEVQVLSLIAEDLEVLVSGRRERDGAA